MVTAIRERIKGPWGDVIDPPVLTLEDAIKCNMTPPSDPLSEQKISLRRVMPDLIKVVDLYAAGMRRKRAFVTFNVLPLAADLLEQGLGESASGLSHFQDVCNDEGHLDLVSLLNKDLFLTDTWPGDHPTTLVVSSECKARITRVGGSVGLSVATAAQIGMALAWKTSEKKAARGTVAKSFQPYLDKFGEAVKFTETTMDFLWGALEARLGRKVSRE